MAVAARNQLQDLIVVGSPRIAFHTMIPHFRQTIPTYILENLQLVSNDQTLVEGVVVCKHCHKIFNDARWNRKNFRRHLKSLHQIQVKQNVKKCFSKEKIMLDRFHSEKEAKPEIGENVKSKCISENVIPTHPQVQFQDAPTEASKDETVSKQSEIPLVPPIEQEKINIMWEAMCKVQSRTKGRNRGRKPNPKGESVPFVEKKRRGRKHKLESKNVPTKIEGGPTEKLTCESKIDKNDTVKVLVEDANVTTVNN